MERRIACLVVSGLMAGGMVEAAWAIEQAGQAAEHKAAPTSASSTQPTTTPPAPPASTPPAPSASTTAVPSAMVEGSITMLDLQSATPTMTVNSVAGKVWTFALDSKSTMVWKDGQMITLDALVKGQSVKIRYATTGGKDLAQSIRVISAAKPAAGTAQPKTQGY